MKKHALKRVMVVDDNHDWVEALSEALLTLGHETRVAFDAFQALEMVAQFKPQVMLIDIEMPLMDGYELARSVPRQHKLNSFHCYGAIASGH